MVTQSSCFFWSFLLEPELPKRQQLTHEDVWLAAQFESLPDNFDIMGQYLNRDFMKVRFYICVVVFMSVIMIAVVSLKGQYHEKINPSTFSLNQISFENKPTRRFEFLNVLSCSRDIHLLKQAN